MIEWMKLIAEAKEQGFTQQEVRSLLGGIERGENMLEHPTIERVIRTGYVTYSPKREQYGVDGLGNEVFKNDEIIVLNDEFFLRETLLCESIELLEVLGASYEIAK